MEKRTSKTEEKDTCLIYISYIYVISSQNTTNGPDGKKKIRHVHRSRSPKKSCCAKLLLFGGLADIGVIHSVS